MNEFFDMSIITNTNPLDNSLKQEIYDELLKISKTKKFDKIGMQCVVPLKNNHCFWLVTTSKEHIHIGINVKVINIDDDKTSDECIWMMCLKKDNLKEIIEGEIK